MVDVSGESCGLPEVRRLTAGRRALYLAVLERTGNQRAAAAAIGMDRSSIRWRRKKDARFDAECRAAEAEASRRLGEAKRSGGDCAAPVDGDFEIIRRGPGGRLQVVAATPGRWCRQIEDRFFEALEQTGNAALAARTVGISDRSIGQRRRQCPRFARRWQEALEEADVRLEFRLACLGNDNGSAAAAAGAAGNAAAGNAAAGDAAAGDRDGHPPGGDGPMPAVGREAPFDPKFALQYLKWREEKKAGRGRRGALPGLRPADEARQEILRRIDALERHRRRESERPQG
jgi:hypothetical protein